jgi:hypothetical protein
MEATVVVQLPRGCWVDGERVSDARLRPLTGEDELQLADEGRTLPAERATALLAQCVERVGDLPADEQLIRSLTLGDREALVLHLRRLTFGERLRCVVTCPEPSCGEAMDVELDVGSLLVPPYESAVENLEVAVDGGVGKVRFRLPTGADQEAAAARAVDDVDEGVDLLLRRCVKVRGGRDSTTSAGVAEAVSRAMAEHDPQADIRLALTCAGCERDFSVVFDAADFLGREIAAGGGVYRDVHRLALHYGWSERDILALPTQKRRRYLDLLVEEARI